MIGGIDITLPAPLGIPVAEIVRATVRQYWPEAYFQDADREDAHPLGDPREEFFVPASREFFIYRDRQSFESWDQAGALPANRNQMLHFLVRESPVAGDGAQSLTVVCDERTEEVNRLIEDLRWNLWGNQLLPLAEAA